MGWQEDCTLKLHLNGELRQTCFAPCFHQPQSLMCNSTSKTPRALGAGSPAYLVLGTRLTPGERGLSLGCHSAPCCHGHRPSESRWSCRTSVWAHGSLHCPGRSSCSDTLCHTVPWSESGVAGPWHPLSQGWCFLQSQAGVWALVTWPPRNITGEKLRLWF